uniref:Uroporphyrinogen decarboxylase (URO-D) domain-containing protein n=1 Tax=Glossina pallidipes TaxID=7398 RepID=A0A1A9ZPA8_GLOPL
MYDMLHIPQESTSTTHPQQDYVVPKHFRDDLLFPVVIIYSALQDETQIRQTFQQVVIGSSCRLDWTVDPIKAREQVSPNITLQGNFDPRDMYKTPGEIRALVTDMVRKFAAGRQDGSISFIDLQYNQILVRLKQDWGTVLNITFRTSSRHPVMVSTSNHGYVAF